MKLIDLIRRESDVPVATLAWLAVISGASNALLLVLINAATAQRDDGGPTSNTLILFVLTVGIYIFAQKRLMTISAVEIEKVLNKVRLRQIEKIRKASLLPLENIDRSEIYAGISKETIIISQAASALVIGLQSAVLFLFALVYLSRLSEPVFHIFVVFIAFAVSVHFSRVKVIKEHLTKAMRSEDRLFQSLTHMLDGFRELKMHPQRSTALTQHTQNESSAAAELKIKNQILYSSNFIFTQVIFYTLIGTMLFVVPGLEDRPEVATQATAAMLFIIGPIASLIGAIPTLTSANVAAHKIEKLEERLEQSAEQIPPSEETITSFDKLVLKDLYFSFADQDTPGSFSVGPINLTVRPGEIIFITGGNGSGKSTLIKTLTTLYTPQSGTIELDGSEVGPEDYGRYRNLFSVISSDYHLFDRLYGLDVDPRKVDELLRYMDLKGKLTIDEGEFSTLDLSHGQKKRIAYLVSILEDRPIYVFDEWAAEQDPQFREKFYHEMLPNLRDQQNKTIIAVTHDDKYFHVADRCLKMEFGKLVELDKDVEHDQTS